MEETLLSTPDTNLEAKLFVYNSENKIILEDVEELSSVIAERRFEILENIRARFIDSLTKAYSFDHEGITYVIVDFMYDEEVKPYGSKLIMHVKVKTINNENTNDTKESE